MTATSLLNDLFNAALAVCIIATVLSLGMTFALGQLLTPLRRYGIVAAMVVVNLGVIPAVAWGIAEAFPIKAAYASGITLVAVAAAGPGGLKAAMLSKRADLPLAVSVVVLLQLINIIAVPLWAGAVVSGASLSAGPIIKDLLLLVLLPLAVGLVIRARYADHAKTWQPELVKVSNLALVIALVAGVAVNWHTIVSLLGSWVLLAAILISVVALLLGAATGIRSTADSRTSTTLVSGMRFAALGLIVIGTALHNNPDYLGPGIVFGIIDLIVCMLVAIELGRRAAAPAASQAPAAKQPPAAQEKAA